MKNKMLIFSKRANKDFENIFKYLVFGMKYKLTFEEANDYISDIENKCFEILHLDFHRTAVRDEFLRYGQYVFSYKKNSFTEWYFIYDLDNWENIKVKKVICNNKIKS